MRSQSHKVRGALFHASVELGSGKIEGYDFEKNFNAEKFFDSFKDTGFQATNLGKAIELTKKMQEENATIFLGFTSNIGTSGLRDIITYLVKNKLVQFLVTTTGGLEEDIIKTHGDFLHGDFNADGAKLRDKGVNRTGNIFIPNERYIWFEQFIKPVLEGLYSQQKKTGKITNSVDFVKALGKELEGKPNCEESFTYWAVKNNIPLLCVPLADGAIGDHIYLFKKEHPDFSIDLSKELEVLYDTVLAADKIGAIILGGSVPKHHIMNACMLREGADYTVYINTGYEGEGSNSGANPEEAKSWGKAMHNDYTVKVWGEATIIFPILVAAGFKLNSEKK
ncbi:MAG: deoxyhypusine synthase [Candidatus Diapherotrites archaeon]|nr:deoxyhypusine synthase [Candidatus Diapherotrites archaeon]